jgi:zona occludens toxin (predicted ATPase)
MAIIAHVGPPRQGKTMFAIAGPVIDALGNGQTVCGNIEGWGDPVRVEKLRQLVIKRKGKPEDFAIDLRFIPHSVLVSSPDVFPRDLEREDEHGTRLYDDSKSLVPFGALLVWDEAKAFTTDAMAKSAKDILAYHGHWGTDRHPFNILLIYQHWGGFAPMVRANVEQARHFKKTAKLKITRWTVDNPGDVAKLPLKAISTVRDPLSIDTEVGECYKSTRTETVAPDAVKVGFFQTEYFKKWRRVIIFLFFLFLAMSGGGIWWFLKYNHLGPYKDKPAAEAQGVVGPNATVPLVQAVDNEPVIVGLLPAPNAEGFRVLVKDGDKFELVDGGAFSGAGDAMTGSYKGKTIHWQVRY